MPLLDKASTGEIARLLELYPAAELRATWNDIKAKTKTLHCEAIAAQATATQMANFADTHFGCCKQHVYLFQRDDAKALSFPKTILDGEKVKQSGTQHALYISRSVRDVVLVDPYEDASIEFLWPVRVDVSGQNVAIRFVMLEKNVATYFQRRSFTRNAGISEADIVQGLRADLNLTPLDIHKGVKDLWSFKQKFMDCHHAKYKTSKSVDVTTMNEEKGIRDHNPDLYKILRDTPITQSVFRVAKAEELTVGPFGIDPTNGTISFTHYSKKAGDSDSVIRKIFQHN